MIHLVAALLLSAPVGQLPENEQRPDQYTRSCMPLALYGKSSTTTATAKPFLDGDGNPVLVRWGTQIEVTCLGTDSTNDAPTIILHQEPDQKFLSTTRLQFNHTNGFPWIDDSAGVSGIEGPPTAFIVPADGSSKYRKVSSAPYNGTLGAKVVTSRVGRCTAVSNNKNVVGGPCATNAECGSSSGVCTTSGGRPDGVFVSMYTADTDSFCMMELCF